MMLLAFNIPSSNYSTRSCVLFLYRTNRMIAGLLQSIQTIRTLALRARTLCLNQKLYSSARVTRRNTLLNDSDDQRLLVFTQCYCISLYVQLLTSADLGASLWKYFTGSTLIVYFTMKSHHKNVIKGSNHILIIQ